MGRTFAVQLWDGHLLDIKNLLRLCEIRTDDDDDVFATYLFVYFLKRTQITSTFDLCNYVLIIIVQIIFRN